MKLLLSLLVIIYTAPSDSVDVETHFKRFEKHRYSAFDSALFHLDRALEAAETLSGERRYGELLRTKGGFFRDIGRFDESITVLKEAIRVFDRLNDEAMKASTHSSLGQTYWRAGNYENALEQYTISRDINLKINNARGLVRNYISFGNHFAQTMGADGQHQYEQALENYREALKYVMTDDQAMRALAITNMGNIYADTRFSGYHPETAIRHYRTALQIYTELRDTINIAHHHINVGVLYENNNQLDSAEYEYNLAIALRRKLNLRAYLPGSYLNLGNALFKKGDLSRARDAYQTGFDIADEIKNTYIYRNLARKIADCYKLEGNDAAALSYFEKYDSANQLVFNEQKAAVVSELETKYGTARKQEEIVLRTRQRDFVMVVLLVVLVMSIAIVIMYSQRQKVMSELRERDKAIMNNRIDEVLRNQEIRSLQAYVQGQDEERKRIAQDLHDRLGSTLSATKLYFTSIKTPVPGIQKASALLDTAVEEVREISHNLLSGSIAKFGLATALEELKETISESKDITVDLHIYGLDDRLNSDAEIHLYRIVQELVSNILKHAAATEITIQLNRSENGLSVTVEDNGRGFNPDAKNGSGVGLQNVQSRVNALEGTIVWDSAPGRGTTVVINIPHPAYDKHYSG